MRFFSLDGLRGSSHTGEIDGTHRWGLPGIRCPLCKAVWSTAGLAYPSVDLSQHPDREYLAEPRLEEDFTEFERLREAVRPLVPGSSLEPGTEFGPLEGRARGSIGPFVLPAPWIVVVRRETLETLQGEGLRGFKGCSMKLRFRQRNLPELLELELLPLGLLHEECVPPAQRRPCSRCGRLGFSYPENPLLKDGSLPKDVDLFRLESFPTIIIATERFVEVVRRLWPEEGLEFRELPVR
jgi:uncharacterized double-CXXCG motif protein